MIHNTYAYWNQAVSKWNALAEQSLAYGDVEAMDRQLKRAAIALMLRDEASGLHYVVSGRKGEGVCRTYDKAPQSAAIPNVWS